MSEFSTILAKQVEPMWRFAIRLTHSEVDAEDLVQRTCVKALENSHQYQEQGRLVSWLFRIEHRIWLTELKSRQMREAVFSQNNISSAMHGSLDSFQASPLTNFHGFIDKDSPESQFRLHQVFLQVESLPDAQRLVVILVCVEGFTYHEAAQILGIPLGTVMSRLARARMTLGKSMLRDAPNKPTYELDGGQSL